MAALRRDHAEPANTTVTALGVISPPPIPVDSEVFKGTLGALFQCVRDRKVDLMEVPLFPVCEAYFRYLIHHAERDLDEASVALVALAYLLERKAWMLLPTPEPEPEVLDDATLMPLASIGEFEAAIEVLRVYQEERAKCFFRAAGAGGSYELPIEFGEIDPVLLAVSFERLLERAVPPEFVPVSKERRSISEMIDLIYANLAIEGLTLLDIVPQPFTKEMAVYSFLALLELVRLGLAVAFVREDEIFFAKVTNGASVV